MRYLTRRSFTSHFPTLIISVFVRVPSLSSTHSTPTPSHRSYRTIRRATPKAPAVKKARVQVRKLRRSVRKQQRRVTKFWLRSGPKSARATIRKLSAARRQRRSLRRALRKARRALRQSRKLVGKSRKQVRAYWKRQVQKARASVRARQVLYSHSVSERSSQSLILIRFEKSCERNIRHAASVIIRDRIVDCHSSHVWIPSHRPSWPPPRRSVVRPACAAGCASSRPWRARPSLPRPTSV